MSFKTFRFLNKYVGTYRVKAPYDLDLEDFPREDSGEIAESFDDLYIVCTKGIIKHTYDQKDGEVILYWYIDSIKKGHNTYNEIKEQYPDIWIEIEETDGDCLIYFKNSDLDKIAAIVKPRTNGANIKPYSDKNLPKPTYIIPEEDKKKLEDIRNSMDKNVYLPFMNKCLKNFDPIIQEKKGKRYNVDKKRRESKLKGKDFIHSIGMWDEFIQYLKDNL